MSERESCTLNFWQQPRLVWRAFNDEWRLGPKRTEERTVGESGVPEEPWRSAETVDVPFNELYGQKGKLSVGPVDLYNEENVALLGAYLARSLRN